MADDKSKVLNPTTLKLGFVSLLADMSSEMLYPITPLFLTSVLGASMAYVGLVEGVAEALASLLKGKVGAWSDQTGRRKPFVVGGYLLSALAKPWIGVAHSWTTVLFARGLDRTGKGFRGAPRDAILADAVEPRLRGAAFGWHRGMDTLGAVLGPLIAILFLEFVGSDLRPLFYWSAIPGLLAVALALAVREKAQPPKSTAIEPRVTLRNQWRTLPAPFKRYLLGWSIFSLANSSDVFLLLKTRQQGLSFTTVILMYCGYNVIYSLFSPWLGGLSDRIPRRYVLAGGLAVFAFVYAGFALLNGGVAIAWPFWTLFSVYGLYMAATDGVGKALAVDLVSPQIKATALGLLGTVTGLSTVIASAVAGLIWDHIGAEWMFVYGAVGAVLAGLIVLSVRESTVRS